MADLITLQEYKTAEGITQPKEDGRLNVLIPSTNKTETFNIEWATHTVQLTESPVNTIVSVEEATAYGSTLTALTIGAQEYALNKSTDCILRTTSAGYKNWPLGIETVKVVYTAGYSAVPADLKLAVIDLMTYYFKNEHKERRTMAGASIQNASTTSQANNVSFPDHIKRVLDLYKNY